MLPVLIAILSMTVLGLPIALAVDRNARGPLLLGTGFLYGSGLVFLAMLALSVLYVQWTLLTVVAVLLCCLVAAVILLRFTKQPSNPATQQLKFHWLDIPTLISMIGFTLFATAAPLWEWDFWAIWGLKARVFLEQGGIDWRFLESRWNAFVHPDYPLLVPLNFDLVALLNGGWSDRWLGLLSVAWAIALLLIVRDLASREVSVVPAAVITLSLTGLAASRYPGLAEGPLIAFGAAGVLFVRRALQLGAPASSPALHCWRHAALLLGFAANVKNEGVALLVSVTIALFLVRPRAVSRLWPAFALAAPWLILRATHALATDIVAGSALSRVLYRLPYASDILMFVARKLYEPWFWATVLAGVLIVPLAMRRREAFVLLVTLIQFVFYLGSYFATPNDLKWHVATSWSRLTDQIAIPITFAVFLMLAQYAARVEESPDAEARPIE